MIPVHDILTTLKPMLADTTDIGIETLVGTHLFDTKLDGVRAMAAWDGHSLTMRNRNGRVMDNYPDLEVSVTGLPGPLILDGEIISESGKFQDASWRDKQRGSKMFASIQQSPALFVAFDILWHPEHGDVRSAPYWWRRERLKELRLEVTGGGRWSATEASTDPKFYDAIRAMGGEGVVAKRLTARYESGRRQSWLKFKSKHRLTCVATGYEPGKGARIAFGAMFLSVMDGTTVVDVGRVGSGFTLPETLAMKAILDTAKSAADLPIVEIECLGVTRDGKLRQPVFLGSRTDLTITDAIAAQLLTFPTT